MKSTLAPADPVEALKVSLAALKSLVSDYALRTRQAEDMTTTLMNEKIPKELFISQVVNKVHEHLTARGLERSTQFLGIIQATVLSLNNIREKTLSPEQLDAELVILIKALTLASHN